MSRESNDESAVGLTIREWAAWLLLVGMVTTALIPVRSRLNEVYVVLAFLLLVQFGSARGGRPLGLTLAALSFLCFNYFLLPPYYTLRLEHALDWLVLLAFLLTSFISAHLLSRAQAEAANARQRAREMDRLASLGAETLNAGRAEVALTSIVEVIRSTLEVEECSVYTVTANSTQVTLLARTPVLDAGGTARTPPLVEWVVAHGEAAAERQDGTTTVGVGGRGADPVMMNGRAIRLLLRPLDVRGRTVGVLSIRREAGLSIDAPRLRVLDALSYYAALAVERVRLAAAAEHAEALQEAHRAKDAVIASVSHDLRTPLTTIKGLAHELGEAGDERALQIEMEADRLNRLVADLLDMSRINSGAVTFDIQPNEAEDLAGAAAQRASGILQDRDLRITVEPSDALLFGRFDFSQTLRAVVNLLENAAKYSPAGSPIDFTIRSERGWLCFQVADRGPGIAGEERERIFEPFYRRPLDAADSSGAGLGLSIARSLVEAQRGSVRYTDRDGGGSVFTVRVPAMEIGEVSRAEIVTPA